MGEFDLQTTLGSGRTFAEDLEDQASAVDDLARQLVFQIALLDRRERAVDHDQFDLVLFAGDADVIDLAGAEQQVRAHLANGSTKLSAMTTPIAQSKPSASASRDCASRS